MIARTPIIDPQELLDAVESTMCGTDNIGFCIACGAEQDGIDQDARKDECEECGKNQVYGAPELLIMGYAGY